MNDQRPNPDELLNKVQREEKSAQRGHLKIFFGACAGVGKTYAMICAAQQQAKKREVLVGIVEAHNRAEILELLKSLKALPRRTIEYHGKQLSEFDLDAALKHKPDLILLDELAHTNVPGSRHIKRWQDVEELLAAGIDVYTTLNVQHLESLNDVVGHITGIRVLETLPDQVFNNADEVTLVDLPPDDLLQRLREGKVYVSEVVAHSAVKNFFRKGNLFALRELALRCMADRVDVQVREYRTHQSIQRVWQTKERILVCIGPDASSEKLVRRGYRLATRLQAEWIAVYVETPQLQKLSSARREQILKILKLAQELGAETYTLAGANRAEILTGYARSRNVSKIIVGRSRGRSRLSHMWHPPLSEQLTQLISDIDLYVVGYKPESEEVGTLSDSVTGIEFQPETTHRKGYIFAFIICSLVTLLMTVFHRYFDLPNIVMLYLLGVAITAVRYGRGPSIFASLLSVLAFAFFFVQPVYFSAMAHTQYLLTFTVMLVVGFIVSGLTSNLRYQARVALYRERRTSAVYALSKELLAALTLTQIIGISTRHASAVFQAKVQLLLPDMHDKVHSSVEINETPAVDLAVAQWVYDHQQPAGLGTQTLPASAMLYLPLKGATHTRGVLAIIPFKPREIFLPEQQRLLDTFAAQIALALERIHYADLARDALLSIESERLHNALLSTISNNLRAPVTAIMQLSSHLMHTGSLTKEAQQDVQGIHSNIVRINNLATNLFDIVRLQGGSVQLNRQWRNLKDVLENSLQECQDLLTMHTVYILIPADLPLIYLDEEFIARVFYNLLENASKYTPAHAHIKISAEHSHDRVWVFFEDDGPGLPKGMEEKIFEKFVRGEKASTTIGVGVGLAICRVIIEAHGGKIHAENLKQGGARFIFYLPVKEET